MKEQNNKRTFTYTYSAKEQSEIQYIRKKYLSPEEDKMEHLRRLDRSVTQKASAAALILGIIGVLIMGIGMCCTMVWMGAWFIPGIFIGVIGIAIASLSYPIYLRITKKERERIAPEILRLTDELMK